jgi:hypothetical protein
MDFRRQPTARPADGVVIRLSRRRPFFTGPGGVLMSCPLGERLRSNAGRLRDLADAHRRTRITVQDGTG